MVEEVLRWEWFVEKVRFEPGVKKMDDESGDDNRDELTSEWGGESRYDMTPYNKQF